MITYLKNTNAILTGASRGLGVYIARALAHEGVNLALAARSREKLEVVAQEMRGYGVQVVVIPTDVTGRADRMALVATAEAELGPIDILINNAGVEIGGAFASVSPAEISRVLETNLNAPLLLTNLMLPLMISRGRGHVITIASLAKLARPFASVYGASKAGVVAWSLALRAELADTGVSVSVVSPGYIAQAGMFAEHGVLPPRMMGAAQPEQVGAAVLRVLHKDSFEEIVSPRPARLASLIHALSPELLIHFLNLIGVVDFERRLWGRPK